MLEKIVLRNFQAHKETELRLSPGVNAIVGTSDSGKSSILRALRWVIENRPAGDALKSHWADSVAVEVVTDGKTVSRSKGKENAYALDGEMFKAFGQDVPEPIKAAFNFSDVNLQAQMDAPFLLASTPGEVARYLNTIAGLDLIDTSLAEIGSTQRQVQGTVKQKAETISDLESKLAGLAWVADAENELREAEELEAKAAVIEQRMRELEEAVAGLDSIPVVVVPKLEKNFSKIAELAGIIKETELRQIQVGQALAEIKAAEQEWRQIEGAVAAVGLELKAHAPRICPTCGQEMPTCEHP